MVKSATALWCLLSLDLLSTSERSADAATAEQNEGLLCPDFWKCVASYYFRREVTVPFMKNGIDYAWRSTNDSSMWISSKTSSVGEQVSTWKGKLFHYNVKERTDDAVIPRTKFWADYLHGTQDDHEYGPLFFQAALVPIRQEHFDQTLAVARERRKFYQEKVMFGEVDPLDLLLKLGVVADRTDPKVGLVSQWMHTLQTWQAMKLDGIMDREYLFAGVIHDVGKLLSLVERDAFADGCSRGLNYHELATGAGLEHLTILFDHHDFGADKLRRYVSPRVYRLMRYHCFKDLNIEYTELLRVATEQEKQQIPEIQRFYAYDQLSKSMWAMPNVRMWEIKQIVREFLPPTIIF